MGLEIDRDRFDEEDYSRFQQRLRSSLEALRTLLARPGFGEGASSLGAELEVFLIDDACRPLPLNRAVLRQTVDPRLTVELDRFNLECNLRWSTLAGRPFTSLANELNGAIAEVRRAADTYRGRVAVIGILPTLREEDLQRHAMTDLPRYRALSAGLQRLRSAPFRVSIDGADPLDVTCDDVTFEGANTSLQLHLRVAPRDFARVYNAVQLATAPALAVAGNSPTFLGHRLWDETRVALFKQVVDYRGAERGRAPRVGFGTGWLRESVWELFAESVSLHPPLLPILGDEDPVECVRAGGVPELPEMRLHQGTIWSWNRAIYDPADGGHLRIEMRGLPAGPSVSDMVANAAFLVGLGLGLSDEADRWIGALPFEMAEHNFYRAAQVGLDAELLWPEASGERARPLAVRELIPRLLDLADVGLERAGVEAGDREPLLENIRQRVSSGQTGARWQRAVAADLEPSLGRPRALAAMLGRYLEHVEAGEPVHGWPVESSEGRVRSRMAPPPAEVSATPEQLLRELGGPALLRVPGRDRSRTRAVVTLLHGNEPSGLRAVHAYLRSGETPAVDAVFLLGSVDAALEPPSFSNRQLPGCRDLNRCFLAPFEGAEGALAAELLERLRDASPEALLDLHNNTGHSPPYGVGLRAGPGECSLVGFFARRYVHSDLALGALIEACAGELPSVVIECGRAGDPAADEVALRGLSAYLAAADLAASPTPDLEIVTDPVRVRVRSWVRLGFGAGPLEGCDLTLDRQVDRHNFERLGAGQRIGWLAGGVEWPLEALAGDGSDVSAQLFATRGDELVVRGELVPIMMTTDAGIAKDDCLFYAVRPARG